MMHRQASHANSCFRLNREREFNLARRAKNLPIPKSISDSDFDEICESFKISPKKNRDMLRAVIDGATPVLLNFRRSKGRSRTVGRTVNLLPTQFRPLRRWGNGWIDSGLKGRKLSGNLTTFLVRWCPLDGCTSSFQTIALAPKIAGLAADFEDRSLDQRRLFIWNRPSSAIQRSPCRAWSGLQSNAVAA